MKDLEENLPSPEDGLSPEEEAEIKKQIDEVENSPEVQRELNKMRLKDFIKGYYGRALIFFVFFAAFVILIVTTQHRDDFTFWLMTGIGGLAVILAAMNIIDIILHRHETKRVFRSFRNAVILIAVSIIFFAIALCSYLPVGNVMLTASMLIAGPALLYVVTLLLRNFGLVGQGRFKALTKNRKIFVVIIYVVESLIAAGMIVGGVFFLLQLSLPLLAAGVVAFFLLLGPLIRDKD